MAHPQPLRLQLRAASLWSAASAGWTMAMILELIGSAVNWMGTGLEFNPEVVAVAKHVGNVWPQQVEMGFIISLLMSVEMILELICSEFNWIDTDMKIIPEVVAVAKQVWNVWPQQVELDIFISIHRSVLAHAKAIGQDLLQWHEMFGQTREMIFELIGFEVNWMGTDVKFILEGVAVAKHVWYEWPQQVELEHAKAIGQDLLHWHEMSGQTMEMILELIGSEFNRMGTVLKFIPESSRIACLVCVASASCSSCLCSSTPRPSVKTCCSGTRAAL